MFAEISRCCRETLVVGCRYMAMLFDALEDFIDSLAVVNLKGLEVNAFP